MKIKHPLIWVVLVAALLLSGCGGAPVAAPAVTEALAEPTETELVEDTGIEVTDDLGRSISLEEPADAIITLAPSATEILFALGAGDKIAARDDYSVYPEEVADIPSIGTAYGGLNTEVILGMEPDLVLAPEIITQDQVQQLADLGLTVYWQANPTDFESLYDNLEDIAVLVGAEEQADSLVADLQERVAAVETVVAEAEDTPLVFYQIDSTDPSNPWTTGPGTFIDLVITKSGGANVGAELSEDYAQISAESLIEQNPDYILMADAEFGTTVESVVSRSGWDSITAVQTEQIYPFDSNLLSVPGPRLVDGLEEVAQLIHPELFE